MAKMLVLQFFGHTQEILVRIKAFESTMRRYNTDKVSRQSEAEGIMNTRL